MADWRIDVGLKDIRRFFIKFSLKNVENLLVQWYCVLRYTAEIAAIYAKWKLKTSLTHVEKRFRRPVDIEYETVKAKSPKPLNSSIKITHTLLLQLGGHKGWSNFFKQCRKTFWLYDAKKFDNIFKI